MPKSRKNQPNNKKRQRSTKKQRGGNEWIPDPDTDNKIQTILDASNNAIIKQIESDFTTKKWWMAKLCDWSNWRITKTRNYYR